MDFVRAKKHIIFFFLFLLAANSFAWGDTIPWYPGETIEPLPALIEQQEQPQQPQSIPQLKKATASLDEATLEIIIDSVYFLYSGNYDGTAAYINIGAKLTNTENVVLPLNYRYEMFSDAALTKLVSYQSFTFVTNTQQYVSLYAGSPFSGVYYWRVIVVEAGTDFNDVSKRVVSPAKRVVFHTDREICRKGSLLFREDFGGNEPTDDAVRQTTVSGLFDPAFYGGTNKYHQVLNDEYSTSSEMFQPNNYIILKKGFFYKDRPSAAWSGWHLQTDHTFPNDETKGYFLEVNGAAGTEKIYSTRLDNLCPQSKLTFTAYFANIVTRYQANRWTNTNPAFRMEVRDAVADTVIMDVHSKPLSLRGGYDYSTAYKSSSPWNLIGFPFEVPDGVTSIDFAIYNDIESGANGMDYALDDIEIRRCDIPTPTITSPEGVCTDDAYQFTYTFDAFAFDHSYRWQQLTGEHQWTDRSTDPNWRIEHVQHSDNGWYRLIIGEASTINNPNCCAVSEPFHLTVTDCPAQYTDEAFCPDGTIKLAQHYDQVTHANIQFTDIYPGLPYNIYARVKKQTTSPTGARITVSESSSHRLVAQFDSDPLTDNDWHEIATSFVVPDWTFNVDVDVTQSGTAPILIDSIAIRICAPKITFTTSAEALCASNPYIAFIPHYTDDGTFNHNCYYAYEYSADGTTWRDLNNKSYSTYVQRPMQYKKPTVRNLPEGWYRVSVTEKSISNKQNCRASSEPVYMRWEDDCPPFAQTPQDEESPFVCEDGTLLFREDFGGNSKSDPAQSQAPVPQMAESGYRFIKDDLMGSTGSYRVVKYGAQNSRNQSLVEGLSSQWHIQDDHTYPNDYTRGYFLEIDGNGSNVPFYTTDINICHEMELSFSAYVANVMGAENTRSRSGIVLPKVRFIIEDANEDTVIHETITDPIDYSWEYLDVPYSTMYTSSNWHLIGTSFRVPKDVENVRLSIFNAAVGSDGNDFALDDIEIRLCNPQVDILSDNEACLGREYTFVTSLSGDNPFTPPYEFRWQFAKDSLQWDSPDWITIQSGTTQELAIDNVTADHDGWYRLTVAGEGNLDNTYCRARSNPFHLNVIDCAPPTLPELTVVSPSVVCLDSTYCFALDTLNKSTLTPFNHTPYTLHQSWEFSTDGTVWTEVATTKDYCFTATQSVQGYYRPVITYQDKWNDIRKEYDPFYLEAKDCNPPPLPDAVISSPEVACLDSAYCFELTIRNADAVPDTVVYTYQWQFSNNGRIWGDLSNEKDLCIPALTANDARWYRVVIGFLNSRWTGTYTSYPLQLKVEYCPPPPPPVVPDPVDPVDPVDPIDPVDPVDPIDPDPEEPPTPEPGPYPEPDPQPTPVWPEDRLFDLIVNKYNWLIVCDNTRLKTYFPDHTATSYKWYKNGELVPNANEDDYSEHQELHGAFQLHLTLDNKQLIRSNILYINASAREEELIAIYNYMGASISITTPQDQLPSGIYIFVYQSGNQTRTEQVYIP